MSSQSCSNKSITLRTSPNLLLCNECGTQYPIPSPSSSSNNPSSCKICDDPRQYVPSTGQAWTTLSQLRTSGHKNVFWQDEKDPRIWSIKTYPDFAIGNRAILVQTEKGNVLWDLIPFLDQETVEKIKGLGGLEAIVISHPHYYSTWSEWSRTFSCPVWVGRPDEVWLERVGSERAEIRFLEEMYTDVLPGSGAVAVLAGGHFPGSAMLYWEQTLFIADTIFTSPSAMNPVPGKEGVISFTFFWSIPNRIPLHPDDILHIWNTVKDLKFHTCLGAFKGMDVYTQPNEAERKTEGVKGRLSESCKIYVRAMGWREHALLEERL